MKKRLTTVLCLLLALLLLVSCAPTPPATSSVPDVPSSEPDATSSEPEPSSSEPEASSDVEPEPEPAPLFEIDPADNADFVQPKEVVIIGDTTYFIGDEVIAEPELFDNHRESDVFQNSIYSYKQGDKKPKLVYRGKYIIAHLEYYDGWIYFLHLTFFTENATGRPPVLARIRPDGSGYTELTEMILGNYFICNDYIYFSAQTLYGMIDHSPGIVDGPVYFLKMKPDGTDTHLLAAFIEPFQSNGWTENQSSSYEYYIDLITYDGDYVYLGSTEYDGISYFCRYDKNDKASLYKTEGRRSLKFVADDVAYFYDGARYNALTGELIAENADNGVYFGNWEICLKWNYSIVDRTSGEAFAEDLIFAQIIGEWIYYRPRTENVIMRVRYDGSEGEKVTDVPVIEP